MKADPMNRPRWSSERGSFIVAMIFFIFLFLIVAAMGVDMGRYFYTQQQNQNIADGAALAAAQAFNQVRSLTGIDRSEMTEAAFHHIAQRTGYDTNAYELSATFKAGDLLSDSFVDATQADYLGDTYIRVGMNVKYYFEPYFLPRWAFGDEFFSVQSQATAELHPVYWQSNLYDPVEPGPPVPALRYSIYSKEDIKPENQECFVVNGDLHSDSGYVRVEEMESGDCKDPSGGDDDWGLDDGDHNVSVDGNIEAGDPSGINQGCSGSDPGAGCLQFINAHARVSGDLLAEEWIGGTGDADVQIDGSKRTGDNVVDQVTPPIPDSPEEDPDAYPGPICEVENSSLGDSTVTINSVSDIPDDCEDGGTIYVTDPDGLGNENLDLSGLNPSIQGDYTFVSDGYMHIRGVNGSDNHFSGDDDYMFMSLNEWIKMSDLSGNLNINATFYAPTEGDLTRDDLCNPDQTGCIKIENNPTGDLTINGSMVAGTLAKVEEMRRYRMNHSNNFDVLPNSLRVWLQRNDIPDYWEIHLID